MSLTERLAEVLRLVDAATEGEWRESGTGHLIAGPGRYLVGEYITLENTQAIAASINFFRTFRDELAGVCVEVEGWRKLNTAFVTHGLPASLCARVIPLWPNPDWTQDQAMIAFALHRAAEAKDALAARVGGE